jgi:hypothetical protein
MLPRSPRTFARCAAFAVALTCSLVATGVRAQEAPPPFPPGPEAPPGPPPMAPASDAREDALTVGGYTCVVGEHAGVEREDARTTADVLCHALASHAARPGTYDIRLGKLGSKLLLVLTERATRAERRLFIQGVEEVPTASERVVAALVENKSIEQTASVDNVVSSEAAAPRQKKVQAGAILGLTAQSAVGAASTTSGGLELDMQFRLHNFALLGQARAGGIGSAANTLGYASLGVGGRYFLGDGDIAPFVGGGLMLAYFQANEALSSAFSGSGFGAYGELGFGFMRSSHVGGVVNLRADIPMFSLDRKFEDDVSSSPAGGGNLVETTSMYLVPLSLNVGVSFQ